MKKQIMSLFCIAGVIALSAPVFANETHSGVHAKAEKGSRKKRQFMCKDCGKPEKQCECKGHGESEEKKD